MCNIRLFTWKIPHEKKLNDNYDKNKIILMNANLHLSFRYYRITVCIFKQWYEELIFLN